VTVELEEGSDGRVLTSHTFNTGYTVTRFEHRAIPPVREVERLLSLPRVDDEVIARHEGIALDNPDELLTRVVEVEFELVGRAGDGFATSELENINEVLVGHLGEFTTFISIEVDVVDVEGGSSKTALANAVADGVRVAGVGVVPAEIVEGVEFEVDTHFVVLESDQWESKTRVAAEPELERDVESVHRGARSDDFRGEGFTAIAIIVASRTTLVEEVSKFRNVTNHLGVTGLFASFLGEFVPDVEPLTILFVNALTTDFDFNIFDDVVTDPVEPSELSTRAVRRLELYLRKSSLEVHTID
jgi:hypothetical protein